MSNRYLVLMPLLVIGVWCGVAQAVDYPRLCVEISSEHPLFVFPSAWLLGTDAAGYAVRTIQAWSSLPGDIKPFSAMEIDAPDLDGEIRHVQYRTILSALQDGGVPAVIRLADADPRRIYPLAKAEELVRDFTCVKGVKVSDLKFNEYYAFGHDDLNGVPPNVRWLVGAIEVAARYGRFIGIELDEVHWLRVMANTWCGPLFSKVRECGAYVVPISPYRGDHAIARLSAMLGLWLDGTVAQWGVGPRSAWYSDAHFLDPGVIGLSEQPGRMPPHLYRAMILNGAMLGACVYSFAPEADLWTGRAQHHWHEAIYPTLKEIVDGGFIARRDFAQKQAKVAYQLAPARTSADFHRSLRDVDPLLDEGLLMHGAYGVDPSRQGPELVLNTGRYYYVPILSPYAPEAALSRFEAVVRPGDMASAAAWTEFLDRHYEPYGEGTAFMCAVGRGIFLMNWRENAFEAQAVRIAQVPTPVRNFEARLTDVGVELTWPFREGDVSYKVYRRVLPETRWTRIANDVDQRKFTDVPVSADATLAYAVTALTNESEPFERTLGYGDYCCLSAVESRIAEEAVVTPLLGYARSQAIQETGTPTAEKPARPDLEGLSEEQLAVALAVSERLDTWNVAFPNEDLKAILGLYASDYEDPQGWRFQYMQRAYQWFFERYDACVMTYQVRRWDFSSYQASRRVDVLVYCRFEGTAQTDASGRFADVRAFFPNTQESEIWISFTDLEGPWRISQTNPALPSFRDILGFDAGPGQGFAPGPDAMP
ncbi:MAG TPA: hypothetical protein PLO37_06080 [Candidatus Hydrogenedentes bacterium]|nr:hypothetical protein [Candidatus Hydrogenedentota bacterium]